MFKNIFLLSIFVLLFACSGKETQYKKTVFDEKNIPLGIHFNQTREEILKQFGNENLREQNADFLFYDIPLKENDSYTYAFKFYNDTLYGMEVGVFLQNRKDADELYKSVLESLNEKLPQHKSVDFRWQVWYVRDTVSGKNTEIEWRDESGKFGVLTMLYNNIDF